MIGALRKVWPWKVSIETEIIRGKEYVLQEINVFPEVNQHLIVAVVFLILGFSLIMILESFQGISKNKKI